MTSAVAGIVNKGGALLRVVISPRATIRLHVQRGERALIVPGLKVQNVVPSTEAYAIVERVEAHIRKVLGPISKCNGCRACCKTPYINHPDIYKPSHQMCRHACPSGCAVYDKRPQPCRSFECLWLKSQYKPNPMSEELRPDKCGAIFTDDTDGDANVIELHQDRDAARSQNVQDFINYHEKLGKRFKLVKFYYGENE